MNTVVPRRKPALVADIRYADLHEADLDLDSLTSMTFPALAPLVRASHSPKGVHGVVAITGMENQPVGLILAEDGGLDSFTYDESVRPVLLRSIFVSGASRRSGVGRALLRALQQRLEMRGRTIVYAQYTTRGGDLGPFECLLQACGWSDPAENLRYCRIPTDALLNSGICESLDRLAIPDRVFPWTELTLEERQQIEADLRSGLVPGHANPFDNESSIDPVTSVGLRGEAGVIGWMVNHLRPGDPQVVCYSRAYAYPPYDRRGRGIFLVVESVKRQHAHPAYRDRQDGEFDYEPSNKMMVRMFERRFARLGNAVRRFEGRISMKLLCPGEGGA